MNMTVTLPRETVDFLIDLGKRIESQPNRATAKPYFFVIRRENWRVAHDAYHGGDTKQVLVDTSGDSDRSEWDSREEFIADLIRVSGLSAMEAEKYADEHLEEFTLERYFDEDNVFFTEDAFKRHVELNGHNLGKKGKHFHDYLKHAFRNPEMDGLFQALAEFAKLESP